MSGAGLTSTRPWEGIESSQNGSYNTKQAKKACKQCVFKNQTLTRLESWVWSTIPIRRQRKVGTSTSRICLVVTAQEKLHPRKNKLSKESFILHPGNDPNVLPHPVKESLGLPSSRE